MINKNYWDNFYKLNIAPKEESNYARFVLDAITQNDQKNKKLIDIACGNGRDTFFFLNNGISATGIDISVTPDSDEQIFIKNDITTFDYEGYELMYMRFIVHALREEELDRLILQMLKNSKPFTLFIETRSSKGITDEAKSETFFKSSIGEEHFRMLYSKEYLIDKFSTHFDIVFVEENTGFSVYKEDDPVCIRFTLKTRI
ncbi:class I SAM-dependent methyltransferase [Crocinitomicaceae bacterium CZZ-1]|uniref:Class I SAM-dependent methyltransferase n=1 Tax=Taishania pollutisoli TaxID=2766479 RepID=A0A8J6PEC5_9FLAO|nr:class I SAM-dependent methyltransferase [Taishania pollutisoli]MBC9813782.1 class I SAM-dependent methyltransferase [Taishania pollutisoli]MBX2950797.1 class I SAM-dependent methyltransferase [Crocinitomicaceae bacterium]NGF77290.1 class I SAM-dependent methyltransferase [Fluviicola sp. SGL-29]